MPQFDIKKYAKTVPKIDNKENVKNWNSVFDQMAVHTRKRKPTELLLAMRPNEEQHIFDYRLANYRAITYGSMNRALDSVSRILNKIQFDVECDQKTKDYLDKRQFSDEITSYDFFGFFEKIVFKSDIEDPNGWLMWVPSGLGTEDNGVEVDPKPYFFCGEKIIHTSEDVVTFLSDEKNIIYDRDGNSVEGDIYWIFTKEWMYKLVQISLDKRVSYRLDEFYEHAIGEIPGFVMSGDKNADGYFESFFAPYCAFGDEAIATFSDWQAIKVTSGFPYTEEFYTECEIRQREVPKRSDPVPAKEEKYKKKSGFEKFPRTPFNTIIRKIPGNKADSEITGERILPADIPSKRFISPDPEVMIYSGESWDRLITKAEDSLHLNLANGTNQSGVAKEKDLEQERTMIDKIGANYFGHMMYQSIKYIDCYIRRKAYADSVVAINTPASFMLKSENDLIQEITTLKAANAPSVFLAEVTVELARKRFAGNPVAKRIFDLVSILDPLFYYDNIQKMGMVNMNSVTKEAYVRSIYCYSILQRMAQEMPEFMKAPLATMEVKFDERLKPFVDAIDTIPLTDPSGKTL